MHGGAGGGGGGGSLEKEMVIYGRRICFTWNWKINRDTFNSQEFIKKKSFSLHV